jgi:hypothetical protein
VDGVSTDLALHGAFAFQGDFGYLSDAKDSFPHVNHVAEKFEAQIAANFDDFVEATPQFKSWPACKNKVKKCPKCAKAVAFSMSKCNNCGTDISSVPISYTPNIFIGFMFGIQKGPFPLTVSLRHQCENYLVFDDVLSLTSAHVNAIPTSKYIPDFRLLFARPAEGKAIVRELQDRAWSVLQKQFLTNAAWKKRFLKKGDTLTVSEIAKHVIAGFNYPPSQYQLHLQYMLPPFLPFQYYQYLKGLHFTKGRFVPVEYAMAVFELGVPYPVTADTTLEALFDFYKVRGVDYNAIWEYEYKRYGESHRALANWQREDFSYVFSNGKAYRGREVVEGMDESKMQANDKLVLQNYGRPYDGKPTGTYYKYAKRVRADVDDWSSSATGNSCSSSSSSSSSSGSSGTSATTTTATAVKTK